MLRSNTTFNDQKPEHVFSTLLIFSFNSPSNVLKKDKLKELTLPNAWSKTPKGTKKSAIHVRRKGLDYEKSLLFGEVRR